MKRHWYNLFTFGNSAATAEVLVARAEASGLDAQNNLGVLYATGGRAFPQNLQAASESFRKAAEKGSALAQSNLAHMYSMGMGQPKDNHEAAKWFRRAALQGDAGAQFHLGRLLWRLSLDGPVDLVNELRIEAFVWLQLADLQGLFHAEEACDELNLRMSKAELEEAKRRVVSFVPIQE